MHEQSTASRCPFAPTGEPKDAGARSLEAPSGGAVGVKSARAARATDAANAAHAAAERRRLVRWGLAAAGFACVAIGGIGTVVPGLPTTIFLIIASWCFTRSCPWLDERMRASRIFAPYVRFLDPETPMPARTRAIVVGLIVLFAGGSIAWLSMTEHPAAAAITLLAGLVGIGCVMLWRRPSAATASASANALTDAAG